MATSFFPTSQYTSENFVESAGVIPFHLAKKQICLVYLSARNEWLLAKGRRNCGESRHQAALREVYEETGLQCHLLPVTMPSRTPPAIEAAPSPDVVRTYDRITEPFMVTIRQLEGGSQVKLIYWYIGAVDEEMEGNDAAPEEQFRMAWFGFEEALQKLTYSLDRDVVRTAIGIVEATVTKERSHWFSQS